MRVDYGGESFASAKGLFLGGVLFLLLTSGCSTAGPPRPYFEEDTYGRYYATESGKVLRVERDGMVLDVTCLSPTLTRDMARQHLPSVVCESGRVEVLGKVQRMDNGWEVEHYGIVPETGTCRSLFAPFRNDWLENKRHSCWHRIWEIPTAMVVYPSVVALAIGIVTAPLWGPLLLLL